MHYLAHELMSVTANLLDGISILIVEDDPDTRALYVLALQRAGATVESASCAEAALAVLVTWRPDVVLCDIHLPGVDGYGLLTKLQSTPGLEGMAVIAISGSHPSIESARSLSAGFARHLTKPARLQDLVAAVRTVGDSARVIGRSGT
jgi:CheY-like chemotaxis protein